MKEETLKDMRASRLLTDRAWKAITVAALICCGLTVLFIGLVERDLPLPYGPISSDGFWEGLEVGDYFDHLHIEHPFSAEVALNRPRLCYNLSRIEGLVNLTMEDGVIKYESHYDPRVMVVLSLPWAFEGKCLSVGLEIPSKPLTYPIVEVNIGLKTKPEGVDKSVLDSMGYNGSFSSETSDGYIYVMSKWTKGEKTQIDVSNFSKWMDVWTIPEKVWMLVYWEGHMEGDYPYPGGFRALVRNETTLSEDLAEEFRNILEAHGIDSSIWGSANITTEVYEEQWVHFPTVSILPKEFDWKEAMKVELEWLKDNGIILNLSEWDIQSISSLCYLGASGANDRILFFNERWKHYCETGLDPYI